MFSNIQFEVGGVQMRRLSNQILSADTHAQRRFGSRFTFCFLLMFAILFLAASPASAKDIYISQSGTGTGTSCTDTLPVAWFNNSANWGSGSSQIGPGTTVHLCGTFTGAPGSTMLTFQGSGTSGNPITLLFESGANLTAPYWSTNGAINTNGNSWLVVNGDITGGRQGIIQNTANGSSLTYRQVSRGILADRCANCVVKNITIANIYIHTSSADNSVPGDQVNGLRFYYNADNLTITNILCHDVTWCAVGTANNFTLSNSEIYNVDHGIADALTGTGTLTNIGIYGNHIHDYATWDTSSNSYHHDGIHIWANSGAQVSGGNIYNNLFDGDVGANVTAHVYIETVSGSPAGTYTSNIRIFNNVFLPPGTSRNYRAIWMDGGAGNPSNNAVYNNFINTGLNSYDAVRANGQAGVRFENNLIMSSGNGSSDIVLASSTTVGTVDYNTYLSNTGGNTFVWQSSFIGSLSQWQSSCSCDANSQLVTSSQINATSDGHLQIGSVAITAGTNLTSLSLTTLNYDKAGILRPAVGTWAAGAYVAPGTRAGQPNPPTNLRATVQ